MSWPATTLSLNAPLLAGGLTLDADGGIFISGTEVRPIGYVCTVHSVKADATIKSTTVYEQVYETCPFLQRGLKDLVWLGMELIDDNPTGLMGRYDLTKKQVVNPVFLADYEYPMALTSSLSQNALYILSMNVDHTLTLGATQSQSNPEYPKWIQVVDPVPINPSSLKVSRLDEDMKVEWSKDFESELDSKLAPVLPAGILAFDDYLLVAGSTTGTGDIFGAASGDGMDGFITKLDLVTGEIDAARTNNSLRIGTEQDDYIISMCHKDGQADSIYLVGATTGSMVATNSEKIMRGFVMKMTLSTLKKSWATEFPSASVNYITHCRVDPTGNVYVGGVVEGGTLSDDVSAYGLDDMFVAQIGDSGTVEWMKQVGSANHDRLAGLELISEDEILLYGEMSKDADVKVSLWTMSTQDGSMTGENSDGNPAIPPSEAPVGFAPTDAPVAPPTEAPVVPPTDPPVAPSPAVPPSVDATAMLPTEEPEGELTAIDKK
jgi:hypothetical protein